METLDLTQGSPEWHAHRLSHFNASDAPAMLGASPYKTRSQLLQEMATGMVPEVDAATQRRFDEGHRAEALARPLAEAIIDDELYPVVGAAGRLSASFDGLTMLGDIAFEHKAANDTLRAAFADIETVAPEHREKQAGRLLPLMYQIQMEQQCMVSGARRVLFMASKWTGDKLDEVRQCWYEPNPELAARITAGWAQFEADLAAYEPTAQTVAAVGRTMESLPALRIEITGQVTTSNLAEYREHALAVFKGIKKDLATDQDFADAEKVVKWCGDVESRLAAAKEHALSQTATIDQLFKAIDDISASARATRLELDKLVTARKVSIRTEIVAEAQKALDAHVVQMNERLGHRWIERRVGPFAEAIKGKRTVDSCRDAASTALANEKIKLNAMADLLDANRKALVIDGEDWFFLFADFAQAGTAPAEHFGAIAAQRIGKHKQDEIDREHARRMLAESQRLIAEQRAAAEQQRREAAEAETAAALQVKSQESTITVPADPEPAPEWRRAIPAPAAPVRTEPASVATIKLGEINARIAPLSITADGLQQLGFASCGRERAAVLFFERDFDRIRAALIAHLQKPVKAGATQEISHA